MNAKELYAAGQLAEATGAAAEEVKRHPNDVSLRWFFCELLCFAGDVQRADLQLDAMGQQDPQAMLAISIFRQLIRAEQARGQFYSEGRLPQFLEQPSPQLRLHLEASIRLREGHPDEAADLLKQAEQPSRVSGVCNGQPFDGMRDLDDLTAPVFEVHTTTGKYYWVPIDRVELIEFHAPQQPRDLLWRRVHMVVRGGPDGEVFLPALYAGSHAEPDDRLRLGRMTDWRGGQTVVRGVGQRMFLFGDNDRSILELKEITINQPASGVENDQSSS